ncbi:helix-turn-helix transcriptional regulator [Parapedobacter sp. 2B3]|uniref:helix-turn-helix transcriptional regulator n=1 Tax=Parapedobacter sp. 2B3 TaxID=3342381 RepID=UPI0035B62AE0
MDAEEIPHQYKHLLIPGANVYLTEGNFGSVLTQEVKEKEFTVWQHHFFIVRPCVLTAKNDTPSVVVNYMLQGSPYAKLKGRHEPLLEENAYRLFFVPTVTHPVSFLEGEYWCIHVNYDVPTLREYIRRNQRLTQLLDYIIQDESELLHYLSGEIDDYMKTSLLDLLWYNHTDRRQYVRQQAYRLLFLYARRHHAIKDDLSGLESYITRNLDKCIEIGYLIKYCAMSSTKFHKKFRAQFGTSPHQYIHSQRMELARTRLLESDMPISRIADLAGYSSLSSFSTAFKRYWGSSPKQIRNPLPVLSA